MALAHQDEVQRGIHTTDSILGGRLNEAKERATPTIRQVGDRFSLQPRDTLQHILPERVFEEKTESFPGRQNA